MARQDESESVQGPRLPVDEQGVSIVDVAAPPVPALRSDGDEADALPREALAGLTRLAVLVTGAKGAAVRLRAGDAERQVAAAGTLPDLVVGSRADEPLPGGGPAAHGCTTAPLVLPDGVVAGVLCVFTDRPVCLTDEQQRGLRDLAAQAVVLLEQAGATREAARRAAVFDRRYRQLVEQSPDAVFVLADGALAYANTAAAGLLGASGPDELVGRSAAEFNDPDLDELLGRRSELVLAGRPVPLQRLRLRHLDGGWIEVEASCSRVDVDGRPGIQSIVRSVREQEQARQAQQALERAGLELAQARDEGSQLRDLLDVAGDVYLVGDAQGRPVEWNRAAEQLFGWTREEALALGLRLSHLLMDEEQRAAWAPLRARFMAGDPEVVQRPHEVAMRHRDGRLLHVEGTWWPRQGPDGEPRLHGLLRDIGLRRQQEAELEAARDAALAASSAKTAFLANMSHEIRTPLNGVLGMTSLLLDGGLPPQQRAWAELAHRSGQGLLSVVNDILDLAKIEAGRLDVVHRAFDLRAVLSDALAPLAAAAAAKDLELRLDPADDLPRTVWGDPDRLRQVLINLLGNAVKFTEAGRVVLSAGAGLGGAVWLAVEDTGPGIAEEDQERLFEPFSQADVSTTRRFGGTGLGLAISRDLVRVLGGELLVSSAPGVGSTFSFSLPLAAVEGEAAGEPEERPRRERPQARLRVLLAEDSLVNQLVAVELLRREHVDVDVVGDGQQALDRLAEDAGYDALLLDLQMPVLDGYDTARALRSREAATGARRLPILALTAAAFMEDRQRCLDAGMDDYLSKPFVPEDLAAALQRVTEQG